MIPRFSIYYTNGDVVHGGGEDDEEVTLTFSKKWLSAPNDGVCHIVVECPDLGRGVRRDQEYYYQLPLNHHGEGDIGCSMKIGPYLRQLCNLGGIVKFGGWTIAKNAHADTHVPKQSGRRREQEEDTADD
jgi:hypothetical protein